MEKEIECKQEDGESLWELVLVFARLAILYFGFQYLVGAAIWSFADVNAYIARNWYWLIPVDLVLGIIDILRLK